MDDLMVIPYEDLHIPGFWTSSWKTVLYEPVLDPDRALSLASDLAIEDQPDTFSNIPHLVKFRTEWPDGSPVNIRTPDSVVWDGLILGKFARMLYLWSMSVDLFGVMHALETR